MSTRILSIQSHVSFGYVGGKAAVFPLQCLEYDVDIVNTVNFSNHSAYHHAGGSKTTAAELQGIFQAMENNELLTPSRLLTGYTANAESLGAVHRLAEKLKDKFPDLIYLLDPVLGDSGKLYVSPDCIPVYRKMLPLATIITPNWFETETLTEIPLKDLPSLRSALRVLHETYLVPNVVISSIPLSSWLLDVLPPDLRPANVEGETFKDYILCLTSTRAKDSTPDQLSIVHAIAVSTLPGYFTGVGDLFSALVLGHYLPPSSLLHNLSSAKDSQGSLTPISAAVSLAIHKTQSLVHMTHQYSMTLPEDEHYPTDDEQDMNEPKRRTRRMRGRELRIVQGRDVFRTMTLEELARLTQNTDTKGEQKLGILRTWVGFW